MDKIYILLLLTVATWGQIVSWLPPYAQLSQAYVYNATHFLVYLDGDTIYVTQIGVVFNGTSAESKAAYQYLIEQCKYIALDVKNVTANGKLWLADVYCSKDGTLWMWLGWLPLRFMAYRGYVEFMNADNITVITPVGTYAGYIPAGWYLDRRTKTVFKFPSFNLTLIEEIYRLDKIIEEMKIQLSQYSVKYNKTSTLLAQLENQIDVLSIQKQKLEELLRQRENMVTALSTNLQMCISENEILKRKLAELEELNKALSLKLTNLSKAYLQLSQNTLEKQEGGNSTIYLLVIALTAIVIFLFIYRRRLEG